MHSGFQAERSLATMSRDQIDKLFDKTIAPRLRELENDRLAAKAVASKRLKTGLAIGAAVVVVTLVLSNTVGFSPWLALIPAFLGAIAIYIWVSRATGEYEDKLREIMMSAICNHVGNLSYRQDADDAFDLKPFRNEHLIPGYTSSDVEDMLTGHYRNCDFTLVEACLTRKSAGSGSSRTTITVFEGMLFRLSLPRPIGGKILIVRDYGSWVNKMRDYFRDGERVEIPHKEFEEDYEVYASDRDLALDVISPSFVNNFLKLDEILISGHMSAAFVDDVFLLAARDTANILDDFSVNTPADKLREGFAGVVKETALVYRLIDQLHEPYDGRADDTDKNGDDGTDRD